MKTVEMNLPDQLYQKAMSLVKEGWFIDEHDIFSEAIRRFLESHEPRIMEKHILNDVEWGLHGRD